MPQSVALSRSTPAEPTGAGLSDARAQGSPTPGSSKATPCVRHCTGRTTLLGTPARNASDLQPATSKLPNEAQASPLWQRAPGEPRSPEENRRLRLLHGENI